MLTEQQLVTLRAWCLNDPTAQGFYVAPGNAAGLKSYLNGATSPAYTVWRTSVDQDEIMLNGFDWARVDNLSVGKARIWEWLFNNQFRTINPSKPNIRAGIEATWAGTQADLNVRAAVYVHCKRIATVAEKVFATGTGSDASPAVLSFEGDVGDIEAARLIYKDNGDIWTL